MPKTNKRRLKKVEITFLIKSLSSYLQIFPIFLFFIPAKPISKTNRWWC